MKYKIFLFLLLAVKVISAQIQDSLRDDLVYSMDKNDVQTLRDADTYFKRLEYLMAMPLYEKLYEKYPKPYLGYLLGSCCAFESHSYPKAEKLIVNAQPLKPFLVDYAFFYGKALAVNDKTEEAIEQYNQYLKNQVPEQIKNYVLNELDRCKNNLNSRGKVVPVKIKNLGNQVNTPENEYSPVFPADESFMVYTYRGENSVGGKQTIPGHQDEKKGIYFEDIYISYKDSLGNFQKGLPITELNSRTHESASYITHDGQTIYLYKNISGSGEIYVSKKVADKWSKPEPLKGICSTFWEGSCCFSADEKTIYFSSDRPGGLGGRDIWKSTIQKNGLYGKPINLGAPINTSSDEDSPFITIDGKLLYFSSNDSKKSIGGYDIFKSEILENGFSEPQNIGKPLNTIQDDKYLVISSNGKKAYYSSEHLDGFGQQDIYEVDRTNFEKPVSLILLSGKTTYDGKPVSAKISAVSLINKDYFSNEMMSSKDGNYFISLPGKSSYEIVYEYNNIKIVRNFSAPLVDSLAKLTLNVRFLPEDSLKLEQVPKPLDSVNVKKDISIVDFTKEFGDKKFENTVFKIQIGAYRMTENFNYARLIGQPVMNRYKGADGITRFTVGEYATFNEAQAVLYNVIKGVAKDAFIIAFKNNKRVGLLDLIKE